MKDKDSEIILSGLIYLPSLNWLAECDTLDRYKYWRHCEVFYRFLREELGSYFGGQKSTLSSKDPLQKEVVLRAKVLIALYSVIRENWEELEKEISNMHFFGIYQPGNLLLFLLQSEARRTFEYCLQPYNEFNPKKLRQLYAENPKKPKIREEKRRIQEQLGTSLEGFLLVVLRKLKADLKPYFKARENFHAFLRGSIHERKGVKGYRWIDGACHPLT